MASSRRLSPSCTGFSATPMRDTSQIAARIGRYPRSRSGNQDRINAGSLGLTERPQAHLFIVNRAGAPPVSRIDDASKRDSHSITRHDRPKQTMWRS
jgi:hypothetical protein